MKKRKGIERISDQEGSGEPVKKGSFYTMTLRIWLHRGDPVVWSKPYGLFDRMELSADGTALTSDFRIDREFLFAGLFYTVLDMRIGGVRKVRIAPHLTPGQSLAGGIPADALVTLEVTVVDQRR